MNDANALRDTLTQKEQHDIWWNGLEAQPLKIEARLTHDKTSSSGFLAFSFQDTTTQIWEGPGRTNMIGEIVCCIGATVEIVDRRSGETWTISPQILWAAYNEMLERRSNDRP